MKSENARVLQAMHVILSVFNEGKALSRDGRQCWQGKGNGMPVDKSHKEIS